MTAPSSRVEPGAVVAGRWHVTQLIGRGDLGEVFEVLDGPAGRVYALKLFSPDAIRGNAWQEYQAIARSASSIAVDTISKVHELGVDPALGAPFAVGERILWPSLDEELRSSRPFALKRVATILELMAPALDSAHLAGLVHRDLRPTNVFTAKHVATGVRITDFGVRTLRAAVAPTPGWAAPVGWAAPDAIDRSMAPTPSMDVFALGTLAFYLLTGKNPYRAMQARPLDPGVLYNELIVPLPPASERARELGASLTSELDPWFATALSLHPKARFSSMAEMAKAFAAISGGAQAPSPAATAGSVSMKRTALGIGAPALAAAAPPRPATAPTPIASASTLRVGSQTPPVGTPPAVVGSGAGGTKVPRVGSGPVTAGAIVPTPAADFPPLPRSPASPAQALGKQTMLGLGAPKPAAPAAAPHATLPAAAADIFDDETTRTQTPLGLLELATPPLGPGEAPAANLRATRLGLGSPGDSISPERSETPLGLGDPGPPAALVPAASTARSSTQNDVSQPAQRPAMPSYRPPAASSSDSGPIALASAKPLAFMPDFPPPPAMVRAAKERAARATLPSTNVPAPPKKRSVALAALFAVGGVVLAVGGGLWLSSVLFRSPKPAESSAPTSQTAVETPSQTAVETPMASETAAALPSSPAIQADTPSEEPAAASATAAADPSNDALVTFNCKPACEVIECDGNKLSSPADGVRLSDGLHTCKLSAERHITKRDTFTVDAGKDQTRKIVLIPLILKYEPAAAKERSSSKSAASAPKAAPAAKAKPKPCGTFINPCK